MLKQRSKPYQIKEEWFSRRSLPLQFLSLSDPIQNPCFAKSVSIDTDFRVPNQLLHPFLCPPERHFSKTCYTASLQSQLSPSTVLQGVNHIHYQTLHKKGFQHRMWTGLSLYWNTRITLTFGNCPQCASRVAGGLSCPCPCFAWAPPVPHPMCPPLEFPLQSWDHTVGLEGACDITCTISLPQGKVSKEVIWGHSDRSEIATQFVWRKYMKAFLLQKTKEPG